MLSMLSTCFAVVPSQILVQAGHAVASEPFLLCVFGLLLLLIADFVRRRGPNRQFPSVHHSPVEDPTGTAREISRPGSRLFTPEMKSTELVGQKSSSSSTFGGFWVPQASSSETGQNSSEA